MKAKEFDARFDDDISAYLDVSKAHRPEQKQKRVNVDFPLWMIHDPLSRGNSTDPELIRTFF